MEINTTTAATARDASLDITFDASLAIYVAASNDPQKIPDSLRSRMTEFEILPPRGEHALRIARVVATRAVEKLSIPGFDPPPARVAHKLAHLSPRAIVRATQLAVAHALVNERLYLRASDIPIDPLDQDGPKVLLH
jgi:ATP-dependent Lon protease